MNRPGLGGGMKRGSGRGRLLDFLPSSSFSPSGPPFWWGKGFTRVHRVQLAFQLARVGFYTFNQKYPIEKKQGTPTLDCMLHNVQCSRAKTF